jgi:hypothetical protein
MQSLLRKIHIYGGLACFWYLIILGVSSLHFNHDFRFMQPSGATIHWQQQSLRLEPGLDDLKLAEAIRDSLSLIGWPLPWEMWRDSIKSLHFAMEQPAKRYEITYDFVDHVVNVTETDKGFWRVLISLHGAAAVPNGPFTTLWQWYTRTTVFVVILSIVTGVYIWIAGKDEKKTGLLILLTSMSAAILWMIKLYFWG